MKFKAYIAVLIGCSILAISTPVLAEEIPTEETQSTGYATALINEPYITTEEFDLFCRCVMAESSICTRETQIAVAETILNRVESPMFPNTITDVIYQPNSFSVVNNGSIDTIIPSQSVVESCANALMFRQYDSNMFYFRTCYFHSFGFPYFAQDNVYFSTSIPNCNTGIYENALIQ